MVGLMGASFGCSPQTFVKTSLANWKTIEFRPDLERDVAYHLIADTLAKNYDIEVVDKDSGYIRSGWMYTLTGKVNEKYRTRVIARIPPSADKVEVKTDAHWLGMGGSWIPGYDTMLLEQVYTDLQGVVGRTVR
jgi:hypothetical protein